MTKKELKRYRELLRETESLANTVRTIQMQLESVSPTQITGMPKGSSADVDRIGSGIAKKDELIHSYMIKKEELVEEMRTTTSAIDSVPDAAQRQVLRLRYISGMQWEDIGDAIGYSVAQTHRIHAKALAYLSKDDTQ